MKRLLLAALILAASVAQAELKYVSVTPTVDTNIYASGDSVGGLMTFTGITCAIRKTGYIRGVTIADKADQSVAYDLLLFKSSPSGTFTNNATADPTDADLLLMLPGINLATTDHFSFADNGISTLSSLGSVVWSADTAYGSKALYGALVTRGTPTYASPSDITVTLAFECD